MKKPHITEAKAIADRIGADAVVILAFKDDVIAGASYGQTKAICTAMGEWMDALIDELTTLDHIITNLEMAERERKKKVTK